MADYQTWLLEFNTLGIVLMAGSVDGLDDARKTVSNQKLTFPVAYGLDYQDISRRTGAFIEHERKILHATGFVLKPELSIQVAAYSTGPIGRLTPNDVTSLLRPMLGKTTLPPKGDRTC